MLEYERIDMSEGVDVNKAIDLRDYIICHYWYFFKISVRFQSKVCNGCNGLLQKAMMLQLFLLKGIIREFIFGI